MARDSDAIVDKNCNDYMSKGCRASLRKLIASVKSKEMHVEDYQFAASVSEPSSKYNEDFNNIRTHVLSNPESQKPPHYAPKPL